MQGAGSSACELWDGQGTPTSLCHPGDTGGFCLIPFTFSCAGCSPEQGHQN